MKSGKELFEETKNKLAHSKLILESSIETPIIKYKLDGEEKIYDFTNYIEDYYTLLANVPTYVSDNSYILKQVPNIKEFITSLSNSFKSPENSNMVDIAHNLEVQMLSKMFSEEKAKIPLVKFIYYKAFSVWLKNVFHGIDIEKYYTGLLDDESSVSYDTRSLGDAIYDALAPSITNEEIKIGGDMSMEYHGD
jgi:hypothetical protein